MKKQFKRFALLLVSLSFASGCSQHPSDSSDGKKDPSDLVQPEPFSGTAYYEDVENRVGYEKDTGLEFHEDFSNGKMDDSSWWVLDGYWDAGGASDWHNGDRSRNLL